MGPGAHKGEQVFEESCCPLGWIILGSKVGSNSDFRACVDWLTCQSMLGNDFVAWFGFYFTDQKGISGVASEKKGSMDCL